MTVFVGPNVADPFERLVTGYRPGESIAAEYHLGGFLPADRAAIDRYLERTPPPHRATIILPMEVAG